MSYCSRCAELESRFRNAVEEEPELPGPMPDDLWEAISSDREAAIQALRIAVRQTKHGILKRAGLEKSDPFRT